MTEVREVERKDDIIGVSSRRGGWEDKLTQDQLHGAGRAAHSLKGVRVVQPLLLERLAARAAPARSFDLPP